jgi:hypothetical protein
MEQDLIHHTRMFRSFAMEPDESHKTSWDILLCPSKISTVHSSYLLGGHFSVLAQGIRRFKANQQENFAFGEGSGVERTDAHKIAFWLRFGVVRE